MAGNDRQAPFTAETAFTEELVHRFTAMQYNLFQKRRKYLTGAVAFVLIVAGLLLGAGRWQGVLPLLIGCVLITNLLAVPRHIANQLLERFHGKLPVVFYRFYPDRMIASSSKVPIHYASLTRMEDDREYLYLFVTPETGYVISKASVTGEGGYEALAALLEAGVGMPIRRYSSLFSLSLRSLLRELRAGRKKGTLSGKR